MVPKTVGILSVCAWAFLVDVVPKEYDLKSNRDSLTKKVCYLLMPLVHFCVCSVPDLYNCPFFKISVVQG